jgi:hypothetical protein
MNTLVSLPILAAMPTTAPAMLPDAADPIFAAIDAYRTADAACAAVDGDIPDDVGDQWHNAYHAVLRTRPTTPAGLAALTTWAREKAAWLHDQASMMNGEDLCTLSATIDDAVRGMSGLNAWSPRATDAELIALGRKYECLVDEYYRAHRPWSRLLAQANAEQHAEFGSYAERGYQDTPEITAAWSERCASTGVDAADDRLSAIGQEREPIEDAINALPVSSIEGLRAKFHVAFFNVAPLCAGNTEYHFQDDVAFQQLFCAVSEFLGLGGKVAGTGYSLPPLPALDDDEEYEEDEEAAEA